MQTFSDLCGGWKTEGGRFASGMGQRRIHLLDYRPYWNRGFPPLLVVVLVFLIVTGSALQFLKLPHLLFGLCRISLLAIQTREGKMRLGRERAVLFYLKLLAPGSFSGGVIVVER